MISPILRNICTLVETKTICDTPPCPHSVRVCHCVSVDLKVLSVVCFSSGTQQILSHILSIADSSPPSLLLCFVHVGPLEIQTETTTFVHQTQISLELVPDCSRVPLVQSGHISHPLWERSVGPCCWKWNDYMTGLFVSWLLRGRVCRVWVDFVLVIRVI